MEQIQPIQILDKCSVSTPKKKNKTAQKMPDIFHNPRKKMNTIW